MKSSIWIAGLAVAGLLALSGCGGGGGGVVGTSGTQEGTSPFAPQTPAVVTAADLDISPASLQIPNSPGSSVIVTVTALDSSKKALPNATVVVSVTTQNAVLTQSTTKTDAQGKLTATISAGGDATLRLVTITATSGAVAKSATLQVVSAGVVASDVDLVLSQPQLSNTSAAKVTLTATALDSGKRALRDVEVVISVASGSDAVVTQSNTKTNEQGRVTADITVGANRANRTVIIEATSGSIRKTTSLQVVGAVITSTLSAPVVQPDTNGFVRYRVVDQATNPMVDQAVKITAPGMDPAAITGKTDLNGEYTYTFKASTTAGQYNVSAEIAGAKSDVIVSVQPASSVPVVPPEVSILEASVSANPSVVPVNATGSQNRTEIRARFIGANNSPIKNVRVRFDLNGDPNSIGGTFSNQNAVIYSDANGLATTAYIPAERPSPTNGLTVRACYGKTDLDLANGACPAAVFTTLTVINDPLGVTIGTDGLIEVNAARLTYIRKYVVQVVDSAGNPKRDVNLSASIYLPWYYKGEYIRGVDALGNLGWGKSSNTVCVSEDSDRNGSFTTAEDINQNGRLDPRSSDVQVVLIETKTGADGLALLKIEYPQNYGSWVAAEITVAASGVLGTEGRASYLENPVPVPIDAIKAEASPPFQLSPYGVTPSCTSPL